MSAIERLSVPSASEAPPPAQVAARALERVLRQCLEALILEELLPVSWEPRAGGPFRLRWQGRDARGQSVAYSAEAWLDGSFGRPRLVPGSLRRGVDGTAAPVSELRGFLQELEAALDRPCPRYLDFAEELARTWVHEARALALPGPDGLERPYAELEASLREAHPYHPCHKSRLGFDLADNAAYAPEYGRPLRLVWLAVRRELGVASRCAELDERAFLAAELGAEALSRWDARLAGLGLDPAAYAYLPVHPWQWRTRVAHDCFAELADRRLVLLGEGTDDYLPQQSIRSLSNLSCPQRATVKLPLAIVNTSADRILSPHHVQNAGPVSDWLEGLRAADPWLAARLVFLREVLGYALDTEEPGPWRERRYGQLSAVWRESVDSKLLPGEAAVPFGALHHRDGEGRLLLAPWLARHGLMPWLEALMERAVLPLVHLLYTQGLGLEAHGQNLVLLHRDGWPSRVAVRDLPGGLRFCRADLAEPAACPALAPAPDFRRARNAACSMEVQDPEVVRDFLLDALGFVNLAELAWALHRDLDLPERAFWGVLARVIRAYQAERPELAARYARYELFAPRVRGEPLALRRLCPEGELGWQARANPLAGL